MADLIFILKVALEGITTAVCLTLAIVVYLRSRKNLPNIYMATAFLGFSLYTGGVLIYDIFAVDSSGNILIDIFIRMSLVSILFGGMFLFFAMMGQGHSRMWYTFKKNTLPWYGIVSAYSLVLIVWNRYIFGSDWVTVLSYQPVDTKLTIFVLIPLIILLFIFFITSTFVIYTYGVKKTEGLRKHNMQRFLTGILIAIGGIVINVLGQLSFIGDIEVGTITVSQILDLAFFAIIAISVIIMFTGIAVRSKGKVPVEQKDMEEKPAK
jgi:hypothetical protein